MSSDKFSAYWWAGEASEEEDEELDGEFLAPYTSGRAVVSDSDLKLFREEEAEEEEDAWLEQWEQAEREKARRMQQRVYSRPPHLFVATPIETPEEAKRRKRREYQRRYRAGQIPRARAREFERRVRGGKEARRKLTYYLPAPLAAALKTACRERSWKRRELIIAALEFYCASPTSPVFSSVQTVPFMERIFHFDEIPVSLWEQVHQHCHDASGHRLYCHYEIVERALNLYLGLSPTSQKEQG